MEVLFLGTGATLPSRKRNVSSTAVIIDDRILLFDCGEGTQRQLMLSGRSYMRVRWIALSHFHGDHVLGIPGLVQSMQFSGREEELTLFGPSGLKRFLKAMWAAGLLNNTFPIRAIEMNDGRTRAVDAGRFTIRSVDSEHNTISLAFRMQGKDRPGRFNPARANRLGIPRGPLFSRLQKGSPVTVGGKLVRPEMVMGPPRPGPSVGYAVDTRPTDGIAELMKDVSVLVFDSTFDASLHSRALETKHSTCVEAATIAKRAGAGRLFLTHISGRYEDTALLRDQAREIFPSAFVARDLQSYVLRK